MGNDVGPPAGPPAKAVTPGEARPPHPVLATALCAGCGLAGWVIGPGTTSLVLYALSYAAGGAMAALTAVEEPRRRRLGLDLLMVLAPTGAAVLGDWGEGAVLLSLFSLSGTLEAYALYRTTRSIDALIKLRPRETTRVRDVQAEKTAAQLFVELWRGLYVAGCCSPPHPSSSAPAPCTTRVFGRLYLAAAPG
jgi:Cd2+/Zn2+-exporting ATPase